MIYSTSAGLSAAGSQQWTQNSPGLADSWGFRDFFGLGLSAARTASGRDLLAIGVPGETFVTGGTKVREAGAVQILFPDPATGFLTATGSKLLHQSTPGIKDTNEPFDEFGTAVASGDFDANGIDDLAVTAPFEDLDGIFNVGAFHVLYNGTTSFTQFFHQNSVDVKDLEEESDDYGLSLLSN